VPEAVVLLRLQQIVSPILHTIVLFCLAAVLAFPLSGPVDILSHRLRNRLIAIMIAYLVVGIVVIGGLTLIAGPFVRQATDLAAEWSNGMSAAHARPLHESAAYR
jgi:predicted PurR-regulated permease PerM